MFSRILTLGTLLACGSALAATGSFNILSYNVAGLPQGASSAAGDRSTATKKISCYVKAFDIVNVQEDFNYHADLYDACDDHPYRTPTSGGAGVGSGLNTLSRFPFDDLARVRWSDCNGVDCLTPKGFTMARTRLAEGVYVDIYNLHAQAQVESADLAARRKNVEQLLAYIETESAGHAVIVFGDTNTRYTRDGDTMWMFLRHGLADAWIQGPRGGSVPPVGAPLLCDPAVTGANCEIVDKVLYRGNGHLTLTPSDYAVRTDAKDANGTELSDHRPVSTQWKWSTASDRRLSDSFGGPHGTGFNDVSLLPANPAVRQLKIRSGSRVDRVEVVLSNGYPFGHGGSGGNEQALTLASGEVLTSASLCSGQSNGQTRIFSAAFTTSAHRTLAGGTTTGSCTTFTAPAGWAIVGFHGRAGDEVDKLGVVYAPAASNTGAAAAATRVVNVKSGLCMDLNQARAADGSNVLQWTCNGGANQTWNYDATTGLVRSMLDPHYCLDNSGGYDNGADIVLWRCTGSANQRFNLDAASGRFTLRTYPDQAVDGYGTNPGDDIKTFRDQGNSNQLWKLKP
jgi:endonuclease/exonuclease/phosphatase family metal-dependent hydrolase